MAFTAQPSAPESSWPPGSLISRLGPASRDTLLGLGVLCRYRAGEVLFRQGAPDKHVALLLRGVTKVSYAVRDGREALLSIWVAGDTVGEMAALNDHPRSATVTACSQIEARVFSQQQFRAFLHADPQAALAFAGMVANRLRSANRKRVDFAVYPTSVRVARVLLELVRIHSLPAWPGLKIGFRITQPEIAALAGVADVTGQKVLRELRTRGLIETTYRGIIVRDLRGLQIAAQLEPGGPFRTS